MSQFNKMTVMPTKLRYKLMVSFCLMSLLPILAGAYIASVFVKFPFVMSRENLTTITLVFLSSLVISFFGYLITRQIFNPIADIAATAENIARGKLVEDDTTNARGSDEIEELSQSLRTISKNARELLDKVERLSLRDKLTGLYNASYIRERLNEEIQRAAHYQRPCSFALFNIDQFNRYVSNHGLEISDGALKFVAQILEKHLSEFDRAARVNKDEFAIIFPDKNKKKAIQIAETISKEIAGFSFSGRNLSEANRLTVSVGVSENPIDGASADQLYVKAQDRLRAAKQKGPNHIEAFE